MKKNGPLVVLAVAALVQALCLAWPAAGLAQDFEAARPQVVKEVRGLVQNLPQGRLESLGLAGAAADKISLAPAWDVYTIDRADLARTKDHAWGGMIKKTVQGFFPVRVEGRETAGVWLERRDGGFDILGVGEQRLARALASARDGVAKALAGLDISDPPEYRLLVLNWTACRLLAVLVRDRLFIWPLPTGLDMLDLKAGLYPAQDIRPLLTGRTGD